MPLENSRMAASGYTLPCQPSLRDGELEAVSGCFWPISTAPPVGNIQVAFDGTLGEIDALLFLAETRVLLHSDCYHPITSQRGGTLSCQDGSGLGLS